MLMLNIILTLIFLHPDPCKEFELVSIGGVKALYASKMGTYTIQNKKINGRCSYRKKDKGAFLFWINSTKSWTVSKNYHRHRKGVGKSLYYQSI